MRTQHFAEWLQTQSGLLGLLLAVLILALAALYVLAKGRESRLARRGAGYDVDTFVRQIEDRGLDPVIARTVYDYLRRVRKVPFPIKPEDALDQRLGLAGRDRQGAPEDILALTRREARPALVAEAPETVEELVRYAQLSPEPRQEERPELKEALMSDPAGRQRKPR